MKTLLKIVLLCTLTVLMTIAASAGNYSDSPRGPATSKGRGLIMFKAGKKMIGATVQILQANGTFVAGQILTKRKLFVDFGDMKKGIYTIRITKGIEVQEFKYEKR